MASTNYGLEMSGQASVSAGNIAIGEGAKIKSTHIDANDPEKKSKATAKEEFKASIQLIIHAVENDKSLSDKKEDIIQLINALAEAVNDGANVKEPKNKLTLKALFREVKETLGSLTDITGQLNILRTAINTLVGMVLL